VMITGDNAQCGFYIARSCGMLPPGSTFFLAEHNKTSGEVTWNKMGGHLRGAEAVVEEPKTTENVLEMIRRGQQGLELGITGFAYDILCESGAIEQLLLHTRIFARVPPDGKVDIVQRHVRRGIVCGMAGDGGNDCGALRIAHAGVALSDAEASVVAPFTSRSKTITSCADLLREGRCSLCTSFAGYKFLITYGMIFPIVKMVSFYYGIIMPLLAYIIVDCIAVVLLSYAMTLSRPQERLPPRRPTSSLLGPTNFCSTFGLQVLNLLFMIGALSMMANDPDYVRWPSKYVPGAAWWLMGDNWESTILFFCFHFQLITASLSYSFGGRYRQPVWRNPVLMIGSTVLLIIGAVLCVVEPCSLTRAFHVASEPYNSNGTVSTAWQEYQKNGGATSPGMSASFRWRLLILLISSSVVGMLWEKVVVTGPVRDYFKERERSERLILKL